MNRYVRSWLYVCGARVEQFKKAARSSADAIVLDLEDSVATSAKESARESVCEFLSESGGDRFAVRINPPRSEHGQDDLAAISKCRLGAIRIPKVEGVSDIAAVEAALSGDRTPELQPIIESAVGLARLAEVLELSGVRRVCLGEGDLSADLGIDRKWFDSIRLDVVMKSRSTGSWQPIQGVYSNIKDEAGLRASSEAGQSQGFFGRSVIHPAQVEVVNAAYTPGAEALAHARTVVAAVEEISTTGSSGVALADGQFADSSTVKAAQRLLAIAEELEGDGP